MELELKFNGKSGAEMKNFKIDIQPIILLIASAILLVGAFKFIGKTNATLSTPTGKCGFVFNTRTAADGQLSDLEEAGLSAGGVIDFDNRLVSMSSTRQKMIHGAPDVWTTVARMNLTFTIVADPDGVPGALQIQVPKGDGSSHYLRIIPVNSSNTFLIQGMNLGATGICQKI
jgi:hypothetical protein